MPHFLIETQVALDEFTKRIKKASRIALDTEADSLHNYQGQVCLIQIRFDDEDYVLDPLKQLDLSSFFDALRDKTLIFHGGDYDLRMLKQGYRFEPKGDVRDTMIGARLIGEEQFSLAALVEKYFGVTLAKTAQKADWSLRPLSDKMLEYARNDTKYLMELETIIYKAVKEKKRDRWYLESCRRVVASSLINKPKDPDSEWRIKGSGVLNSCQLNRLKHLWHWREKEAEKLNVPPFKVYSNQDFINWSLAADQKVWERKNQNASQPIKLRVPRRFEKEFLAAIKQADSVLSDQWPEKRPKKIFDKVRPDEKKVKEFLGKCRNMATQNGMDSSLLVSRSVAEQIQREKIKDLDQLRELGWMMEWQIEMIQPFLLDYFRAIQEEGDQGLDLFPEKKDAVNKAEDLEC